MSTTIDVYFSNGHMARIPEDRIALAKNESEPGAVLEMLLHERAVVNFDNVCFMRHTPEPKDDDD